MNHILESELIEPLSKAELVVQETRISYLAISLEELKQKYDAYVLTNYNSN